MEFIDEWKEEGVGNVSIALPENFGPENGGKNSSSDLSFIIDTEIQKLFHYCWNDGLNWFLGFSEI